MIRNILIISGLALGVVSTGHAQDVTMKKSTVTKQEGVDCVAAWDVVADYHDGKKKSSYFSDTTAEEANENVAFWTQIAAYSYPKKKKRKKALKKNYVNDMKGMPKDAIRSFTGSMLNDCKGLRKNIEVMQGKMPAYPDAMTAAEILEERAIKKNRTPATVPGVDKGDMVDHATTVVCKTYFDNMVATYKDKDSEKGLEMFNAYVDQQNYWETEKAKLPAGVEDVVRSELSADIRQAKSGKNPMRTLICLSERGKRNP